MAQKQILTYPCGTKYNKTNWANQVKDGTNGSIPCNNGFRAGTTILQDSQSGQWWGDEIGQVSLNFGNPNSDPFNQTNGDFNQRGAHYYVQSKKNQQWAKWIDIGAEGGKSTGYVIDGDARSSWLREVTALWFLFHGHTTHDSQGCYAHVEKVGIRYRDPNGYLKIYKCTEKLGDLSLNSGVRGNDKYMFGYAIPSNERQTICRNDYRFLGVRIQIMLRKTDGTMTRTICGGCTGIRLGLGENPTASYNETNKRALVGIGNSTWNEFNDSNSNFQLETR